MGGVSTVLANLLIKWNLDSYILIRIRVIMGFLIIVYYMTFGLSGVMVRPIRFPEASALDAVGDTALVYLMGAMQTAPFKNEMFPIWAVLLVSFRSTVNFVSKYNTQFELVNMVKLWAAAMLSVRHGSKSMRAPFWLFWCVLVAQSLSRIRARRLASRSLWHGRSSELVREYMGSVDHNLSNFNPVTLEGCKYLVYGKSKKNTSKGLSPSINDLKSVVSLDSIWLHNGTPLVRIINRQKNTIKDMTLAFALSRLLRCRMEGGRLHEDTISMTREIICSRIIHGKDNNKNSILAGILEMDLSFIGQHIHTGYPMVFCQGLRSLYFPALKCVLQFTCCLWLLGHIIPDRKQVDALITVGPVFIMLVLQTLEVLSYVSSYWTILLLVCNYVNCRSNTYKAHVFERIISSVPIAFSGTLLVFITSRFDLLQSSSYSQGKLRRLPITNPVTRQFHNWKCYNCVIGAITGTLARYMDEEGLLPRHRLPSPRVSDRVQRYWSACLELPSCTHVILVWHIATSLCQVKLERDRGDTNNRRFFRLFAGNTRTDVDGNVLSKANAVATCLSRYCLNLVISKPNLLPEDVFASKKLLLDTIQNAHDILRGCTSPQSRYDELFTLLPQEAAVTPGALQDIKLCGNILVQGAVMANELIHGEDEQGRWDILAEVWADILVQIAPSSKAEAHGEALKFGAGLVTIVWALLCHCGIEKSELWQEGR